MISKWLFKFSTSRSAFEEVFRFLYLLVLYGGKNEPRQNEPITCSLYTVLGSFSQGREIFPQKQPWFSPIYGSSLGFYFLIIFLSSL